MRLLVEGGWVVTCDREHRILRAELAVVDDRIAGIGAREALVSTYGEPEAVLGAAGRYVIPGLVNTHTHAFQTAFRGLGDGLSIGEWQRRVTHPAYTALTAEDAYWFTLVGCLENVRSGVTAAVNFQAFPNDFAACELMARAFGEVGLRGLLVKSFYGENARGELLSAKEAVLEDVQQVFEELHGTRDGRVRFCVGPPGAANAPADWIQQAHAVAAQHGSGLHVHVAENRTHTEAFVAEHGLTETRYFEQLGVLDARFIAAHGVWMTPGDLELMARRGAHVAHCPVSNMYLGSGIAPVQAMLEAGVHVALGTDGAATNNNQDMFAVMKAASLLQKVAGLDPSALAPGSVLEMAARHGARAMQLEAGTLEAGQLADLVVVDLSGAHNQPLHRPVSALIYSAHVDDVESVVVGGRIVLRNRQFEVLPEPEILAEASRRAHDLLDRAGVLADVPPAWPWQ